MNRENFKLVLDKIDTNRESYDQRYYHHKKMLGLCGTTHCVAGWAQILSGRKADDRFVVSDAREFLGLTMQEAKYVFYGERTIDEIYNFYNRGGLSKKRVDSAAKALENMVGIDQHE